MIDDFLSGNAKDFFEKVTAGLDAAGVAWVRAPTLVRGLDYYRHTAFEFVTDRLGAQGTVLGGGRYDGLIEALGGPHTPAVGWAAGIERLAMLVGERGEAPDLDVVVFSEYEQMDALAVRVAEAVRHGPRPLSTELLFSGSRKKRFQKAKASGAWRALSIEPYDGAIGVARLRDLNVPYEKPMRNKVKEALEARFECTATEIANAHSWIITGIKGA
jgi:histidyl-tRNA synthetase